MNFSEMCRDSGAVFKHIAKSRLHSAVAILSGCCLGALAPAPAIARTLDGVVPVTAEPLHKIRFDNGRVRMYEVVLPSGQATLFHEHRADSFTVMFRATEITNEPHGGGEAVVIHAKPGAVGFTSTADGPYSHRVIVSGETTFHVIAMELLSPAPAGPAATARNPGAAFEVALENPRGRAYRVTLGPGESTGVFTRPAGTALFAISGGRISETVKGKAPRLWDFEPANFRWFESSEKLSLKNEGATPVELVEIEVYSAELPRWSFAPEMIFPTDRSLSRPEDGVVLADGRLIVADQFHGLRLVRPDGSSRPFGRFSEAGYVHSPPDIERAANGVTLEPAGTHILVSDVFRGGIYRVDIANETSEQVYQHPFGVNMSRGDRAGGIWFTQSTQNRPEQGDAGLRRALDTPTPDGALFYLPPRTEGRERAAVQLDEGLHFANGIALDETAGYLYLAETMGNGVLRYRMDAAVGRVSDCTVVYDVFGADNIELDRHGRLWIAVAAQSEIIVLDPATQTAQSVFRISTPESERSIERIKSRLRDGASWLELLTPLVWEPAPGLITGMILSPDDGPVYVTGLGNALIKLNR